MPRRCWLPCPSALGVNEAARSPGGGIWLLADGTVLASLTYWPSSRIESAYDPLHNATCWSAVEDVSAFMSRSWGSKLSARVDGGKKFGDDIVSPSLLWGDEASVFGQQVLPRLCHDRLETQNFYDVSRSFPCRVDALGQGAASARVRMALGRRDALHRRGSVRSSPRRLRAR